MSFYPAYQNELNYTTEYPETVSFGMMSARSGRHYRVNARWTRNGPEHWQYSISESQSSVIYQFSSMELIHAFLRTH
jgi:hypothetical protein